MAESKWYTVKVQSNREKNVSDRIQVEMNRSESEATIVVPTERVYFAKNGKKAYKEKVIYPGYVFVGTSHLGPLQECLKHITGASGVLRDRAGTPSFLQESEINRILLAHDESKKFDDSSVDLYNFVVGEEVVIVGGPFDKFKGIIDELNKERGKVKVSVPIFGRTTPVDLQLEQIEKILE